MQIVVNGSPRSSGSGGSRLRLDFFVVREDVLHPHGSLTAGRLTHRPGRVDRFVHHRGDGFVRLVLQVLARSR